MDKNIAVILYSLYNSLANNMFDEDKGEEYDIDLYQLNNLMSVVGGNNTLMNLVDFYETAYALNIKNENVALTLLNNLLNNFQIENSYEEYCEAKKQLDNFTSNGEKNELIEFYINLSCVLENSYKSNPNANINDLATAFENVLKFIINKDIVNDNTNDDIPSDDVFNLAVNRFNEKYVEIGADDRELLNHFFNSSFDDDKSLYDRLKNETIGIIENLLNKTDEDSLKNRLTNAKEKIVNMSVDESNIQDEIIKLYELKKFLTL